MYVLFMKIKQNSMYFKNTLRFQLGLKRSEMARKVHKYTQANVRQDDFEVFVKFYLSYDIRITLKSHF